MHTSALVGAGHRARRRPTSSLPLAGRVRLLFQPAEEVMPGGALEVIAAGALDDVEHVFGLHCDPTIDVGQVGLRVGPLTGAADALTVRLTGRGGHTSRPHLTEDLTYALGKLVTELPGALSRRLDPRAGASLVWGVVRAGSAKNVIPASGEVAGTLRMLDAVAWADAEDLVRELIGQILAPYGVGAEVTYVRGVPPVVNEPGATALLARRRRARCSGSAGAVSTPQSLGGEDFAWYLEDVPGAMGRLGTRTPGGRTYDLHQGDLHIDERAIGVGAKVLAAAVLTTLDAWHLGVTVSRPPTCYRTGNNLVRRAATGPRSPAPGIRVCPGLRLDRWRTKQGGILRRLTKIAAVTAVLALAVTGCAKKDTQTNTASGG